MGVEACYGLLEEPTVLLARRLFQVVHKSGQARSNIGND